MDLAQFQDLINTMYSDHDRKRGASGTFVWFMEEIGELASAIAKGTPREKAEEFADVLAWLTTLANVENVDLSQAIADKYGRGCPGCHQMVCTCNEKE